MSTTAAPEQPTESLTQLLGRIASDPAQTDLLHQALGKYCHECRNLLNSIKMSIYLAKRNGTGNAGELWQLVEPRYVEVEQLFSQLHDLCRPSSIAPARLNLDILFHERFPAWQRKLGAAGMTLHLVPPITPAVGQFDPTRLGVAFDGMTSWRGKVGAPGAFVSLAWGVCVDQFRVSWEEKPAARMPEATRPRTEPIDVLCLPILTRVISLHGGKVATTERPGGGWRLDAEWPA